MDLFEQRPCPVTSHDSVVEHLTTGVPIVLTDAALIAALPVARLKDCLGLAAEAGRRKLAGAVPALDRLCRRFSGWGKDALVPEQVAALDALTRIGGRSAGEVVVTGIVQSVFIGPTLGPAVVAAAALDTVLPEKTLLRLLRHGDPHLRANACRCVRASPPVTAVLIELLDDLHPAVVAAAACALGRTGRIEGRPHLTRILHEEPTPEIIEALVPIADKDDIIQLGRLAQRVPVLAPRVLNALETSDHPHAAAIASMLQGV
jgi:HEAT repeats